MPVLAMSTMPVVAEAAIQCAGARSELLRKHPLHSRMTMTPAAVAVADLFGYEAWAIGVTSVMPMAYVAPVYLHKTVGIDVKRAPGHRDCWSDVYYA